jgi:CRISPR-associated protein (TIGR03986 family)
MSWPQHQNPTQPRDTALAPYNFVPLPEQVATLDVAVTHSCYHSDRHTGLIRCTLTTVSPLYTRAALERDEYDQFKGSKDKTESFYIDPVTKEPVLRGSSLRGMLRTLVEIASFGKLDAVGETPLVYRAVGDTTTHGERYRSRLMQYDGDDRNSQGKICKFYTPLMQAGYIKKLHGDRWQIQPAQNMGGVTFARINLDALDRLQAKLARVPGCRNAATIYIQPSPYDYQEVRGGFLSIKQSRVLRAAEHAGPGLIAATVARSGPMASKRSEAVVFPADPQAPPIAISDDLYDAYIEQLSQEQKKLLGDKGVFNDGQPVFYLIEAGKLVFFSHTMMMRLPYEKTPIDFVPEELRSADTVDLAEAIFGYVRQSKQAGEQSRAGRVFVGDAHLAADQDRSRLWLTEDAITLKILGSPKPTTFQHYLTQQDPDPQIDRYTRDGRPQYKKELADYTAAHQGSAVLRGHKLYWHKGAVTVGDLREEQGRLANAKKQDTQHTRVKPVAEGVRFEFTIRFENLDNAELGALLWALTLPGEADTQYRHKLGMGKPLGMGSVQLQAQLFLSNRQQRYRQLFADDGTWAELLDAAPTDSYVQAYEAFVLTRIHPAERGQAQRLSELLRIKMLLKLLEWPGPAKEQTRYLEIEREDPNARRGKVNEYRGRPVLPDPLAVVEPGSRPATRRTVQTGAQGQGQQPSRDRAIKPATVRQMPTPVAIPSSRPVTTESPKPAPPAVAPVTKPAPELAKPQSLAEVKEGMWLEGKVVRVELNTVFVDVGVDGNASLYKDQIHPTVRDQEDLEERFSAGKVIRVWVKGFNKRGRMQLTLKEPRP